MKNEFSLYYTTWPDEAGARRAAQILLEEKLVACANLFPVMESQYWWEGKIESSKECVLILKSRADLQSSLQKRVEALHPYQVPCFLELVVNSGNNNYLNWLNESLK